ncbi:MAG: hypothetical protein IPI68_12860 [Chitinophagaceae bacterium]|nr:hypothetical protein [Chitinophagaceae bacterium]
MQTRSCSVPVQTGILSHTIYTITSKFNYVISKADIDGKTYYLDASEPRMGFGFLPLRCYNGAARIINKTGDPVELNSESVTERKITSVFIINDEKGKLVGSLQQMPGNYESYDIRNRIKEKGKEELQKGIQKGFGAEITITALTIDSLDQYDHELNIKYDFDFNNEKEDIIYLNPMFSEGQKENLFKSAERVYPVEMPFAIDETYNLQMEVPVGYEVDELPQSLIVKMNEQNDGMFEYRISKSGDNISFRSHIWIRRTYFLPDEYEMLREFFNLIVKKHVITILNEKAKIWPIGRII